MSHTATVFYGLTVRASDLIAAALAYPSVEPTLRAIDLIQLRRQRSTLEFHPSTRPVLMQVPPEVWDAIKSRLITLAVAESRADLQREASCLSCENLAVYGQDRRRPRTRAAAEQQRRDQKASRTLFKRRRNNYSGKRLWTADWIDHSERVRKPCHKHWQDKTNKWTRFVQHQLKQDAVNRLLRNWGLCLGLPRVFTHPSDNRPADARHRANFQPSDHILALSVPPLNTAAERSSTVHAEVNSSIHYHSSNTTIASLPAALLHPPADSERRFARFLSAWHIAPWGTVANGEEGSLSKPRLILTNTN